MDDSRDLLLRFNGVWSRVRRYSSFWDDVNVEADIRLYSEFIKIPELTKKDVRCSIDQLRRGDMKAVGVVSTGGSTGAPLRLPVGGEGAKRTRLQQAVGRSKYGINYRDRCFLIWGHSTAIGSGMRPMLEKLKRALKDRILCYYRVSAYRLGVGNLRSEFEGFLRFHPKWVCGYSSAVVAFARANWERRASVRSLRLKAVLCSAEMLSRSEAEELGEFFGAPVAIEYGSVEFGPIAYSYPDCDGLFVMDDLLVEAISTDRPGIYRLLVTALYDQVVPLIRYDIGDEVRIEDPTFSGGIVQRFDEVYGRRNDMLCFSDGSAVHSETITHVIKNLDGVLTFQFHQWSDRMQLNLVICAGVETGRFVQEIRRNLESVNVNFKDMEILFVDDVDVTSAGKRRWIVVH